MNFPLRDGIDDESYEHIFQPVSLSGSTHTLQPTNLSCSGLFRKFCVVIEEILWDDYSEFLPRKIVYFDSRRPVLSIAFIHDVQAIQHFISDVKYNKIPLYVYPI